MYWLDWHHDDTFGLRRKKRVFAGRDCLGTSGQTCFYVCKWPSAVSSHALRIEECVCHHSRGTSHSQYRVSICPCLFRRSCHTFAYARRTFGPCSTCIDVSIRRYWGIELKRNPKTLQVALIISLMSFGMGCSKLQHKPLKTFCRLEYPNSPTELRSILALYTVFHHFAPNIAMWSPCWKESTWRSVDNLWQISQR